MEKTTLKDELLSYIVAGIVNVVLGAISFYPWIIVMVFWTGLFVDSTIKEKLIGICIGIAILALWLALILGCYNLIEKNIKHKWLFVLINFLIYTAAVIISIALV